jgi:phosphoglycerol transferase MdoB-like AlkP superfamily enzyme
MNTRWTDLHRRPEVLLARRLGVVLAAYFVIRLVFLVDHRANFAEAPMSQILGAFVRGVRFDLSAIAYTNMPFILLSLAPIAVLTQRWYQRVLMTLFLVVNGAFVVFQVGDIAYYPFTGTRVTMDIFALTGEATAQADQLFLNFAGLTIIGLSLIASLWAFYPKLGEASMPARSWLQASAVAFATILLTVIAARGGVQKKPLNPIHAFASGNHEIGILTLNTSFTLIQSPRGRQLQPVQYFATDAEVDSILQAPYGYAGLVGAAAPSKPQNVVLLLLESFGTEYWGGAELEESGLTPFLDSLSQQGTFFTNSFANGRRSMDALPSILLGVPLYTGQSLAVSRYQGNQWLGLGHFLEGAGFHTSMFHGAVKGTMYFDAIASMAGIREFYPLERFPEEVQRDGFDGHWGLFDEPALQFAARQLTTHPEPFFTTLFTISTHHPFRVPPEYEATLPRGSREIHQSVAYVDYAVRQFFETARQQPWFENTLFIITGDHTPPMRSQRYDTPLGRYMVPILLYQPGRQLPALDSTRIAQHVDIFKTVLDFAGVRPPKVPSFGRSLFADVPGEAVLATDEVYWIVRKEGVVERVPDGRERLFAFRREETGREPGALTPQQSAEMSERLRAYVQHFTMSMINNSFYRDPAARASARGDN